MSLAETGPIRPPRSIRRNIYGSALLGNTPACRTRYAVANSICRMDIADRLDVLMKAKGLTQYRLGELSGVPQPTIQRILSRETKSPKTSTIEALAAALGVSGGKLLAGDQDNAGGVALGQLSPWDDSTPLGEDEVAIPFFKEVELAAGHGLAPAVELNHRKLRFSRSTLDACGVDEANAACATVRGNSMERLICDGSTIGIDRGRTEIRDGEIYAIDQEGMLRVKYLYRLPGGGLRLRSENSTEYPDELLSFEQCKSIRVLGWVFWWSTVRTWKSQQK